MFSFHSTFIQRYRNMVTILVESMMIFRVILHLRALTLKSNCEREMVQNCESNQYTHIHKKQKTGESGLRSNLRNNKNIINNKKRLKNNFPRFLPLFTFSQNAHFIKSMPRTRVKRVLNRNKNSMLRFEMLRRWFQKTSVNSVPPRTSQHCYY